MATRIMTGNVREANTAGPPIITFSLAKLTGGILTYGVPFVLGFLCTKAVLFGNFTPFGMSVIPAAFLTGLSMPFTLFGVAAGYLFPLSVTGIRYAFGTGLLFLLCGLAHALPQKFVRILYFLPGALCFICGFGFIYINTGGTMEYILLLLESVLCTCGTYFLAIGIQAVRKKGRLKDIKELVSLCVLSCVLLISADGFAVADVNIGRIISAFIILLAVSKGGVYHGSVAGVIAGLAVCIQNPDHAYLLGAFALAGIASGIFRELGGIAQCAAYCAGFASVVLVNGSFPADTYLYAEAVIGAAAYYFTPNGLKLCLQSVFYKNAAEKGTVLPAQPYRKIQSAAEAVLDMSRQIVSKKRNEELINISSVFHLACESVCIKCEMRDICWDGGFHDMMNAFNSVTDRLLQYGRIGMNDLPEEIRGECVQKEQLTLAINGEYQLFRTRIAAEKKIQDTQNIVTAQCEALNDTIQEITDHAEKNDQKFKDICRKTEEYFFTCGIKISSVDCESSDAGNISVTVVFLKTNTLPSVKQLLSELSAKLNVRLSSIDVSKAEGGKVRLVLSQALPYRVECASLFRTKSGEAVCGDSASAFLLDDRYILAVSDGMGSGDDAAQQSEFTLSLTEKMMKSGFDMAKVSSLINSALYIKDQGEVFATLDVCQIDLFTGDAEFLKCCAAPTYIMRGENLYELKCSSLPVGVQEKLTPSRSKAALSENDVIIMVSDGVLDGEKTKFEKALTHAENITPGEICKKIADYCLKLSPNQRSDDMTILVAKIVKNKAA